MTDMDFNRMPIPTWFYFVALLSVLGLAAIGAVATYATGRLFGFW